MSDPISLNAMAGRVPPAPILAILSQYSRHEIEGFIEVAIDLLDIADGDSDLEGAHDEDEISTAFFLIGRSGPGCPIADPDESVEDGNEDDSSNDREACHD